MGKWWKNNRSIVALVIVLTLVLSSFWLGCGKKEEPTGPGEEIPQVAGVWEGTFQSSQSALQGTFCVVLQQDGNSLTGQLYVAGQGLVGNVTGQIEGQTITYGVAGGLQFSGQVSGSQASGSYSGNNDQGTWEASLTGEQACDWASLEQVNTFQNLLLNINPDDPGASQLAYFLATTITRLPTTSISVGNQQADDWWICIWELDNVPSDTGQYRLTVGAAYGPNPASPQQQAAVWWITPEIHQQTSSFPAQQNEPRGAAYIPNLAGLGALWYAMAGEYRITGDSDPGYQNPAYLVLPDALGVSGITVEVRTTRLSGYLSFTAADPLTGTTTPVRLPASGDWQNLEAVHIRFVIGGSGGRLNLPWQVSH